MLQLNSDKSIYIQIAEKIANDILLGKLKEDDQAPSTNDFARVYAINPATARKGLNILAQQGILYKKRGLGMYVAPGARKKILKQRQEDFFQETIPHLVREASRLEISLEEVIKHIKAVEEGK